MWRRLNRTSPSWRKGRRQKRVPSWVRGSGRGKTRSPPWASRLLPGRYSAPWGMGKARRSSSPWPSTRKGRRTSERRSGTSRGRAARVASAGKAAGVSPTKALARLGWTPAGTLWAFRAKVRTSPAWSTPSQSSPSMGSPLGGMSRRRTRTGWSAALATRRRKLASSPSSMRAGRASFFSSRSTLATLASACRLPPS